MSYNIDLPHFTGRNVPISEIANATGKDPQYLRIGLQENSTEYNYFCPDKKVWEELGYFREVTGDDRG